MSLSMAARGSSFYNPVFLQSRDKRITSNIVVEENLDIISLYLFYKTPFKTLPLLSLFPCSIKFFSV